MTAWVSVTLKRDALQKEENLGAIEYSLDQQANPTFGFKREIAIAGNTPISIVSSYDSVTCNLSIAVLHSNTHYLMVWLNGVQLLHSLEFEFRRWGTFRFIFIGLIQIRTLPRCRQPCSAFKNSALSFK